MLISIFKKSIIYLLVLTLSLGLVAAQPANKAKERIAMMKKMKLLEILNLDEQNSEKFLIKYTIYEKKVDEQRMAVDAVADELGEAIKKDASKDEIANLTDKLINSQSKLNEVYLEKLRAFKTVLEPKEYAKFLVFESKFMKELQKILLNMAKGKGRGPGGRGPGMNDDE
ncbi:MAG: hypothetical protein HZB41_05735 [Ignavibacteriae bacterium]|nr:hypothetical protein [Ignavibacteriota bacterium]